MTKRDRRQPPQPSIAQIVKSNLNSSNQDSTGESAKVHSAKQPQDHSHVHSAPIASEFSSSNMATVMTSSGIASATDNDPVPLMVKRVPHGTVTHGKGKVTDDTGDFPSLHDAHSRKNARLDPLVAPVVMGKNAKLTKETAEDINGDDEDNSSSAEGLVVKLCLHDVVASEQTSASTEAAGRYVSGTCEGAIEPQLDNADNRPFEHQEFVEQPDIKFSHHGVKNQGTEPSEPMKATRGRVPGTLERVDEGHSIVSDPRATRKWIIGQPHGTTEDVHYPSHVGESSSKQTHGEKLVAHHDKGATSITNEIADASLFRGARSKPAVRVGTVEHSGTDAHVRTESIPGIRSMHENPPHTVHESATNSQTQEQVERHEVLSNRGAGRHVHRAQAEEILARLEPVVDAGPDAVRAAFASHIMSDTKQSRPNRKQEEQSNMAVPELASEMRAKALISQFAENAHEIKQSKKFQPEMISSVSEPTKVNADKHAERAEDILGKIERAATVSPDAVRAALQESDIDSSQSSTDTKEKDYHPGEVKDETSEEDPFTILERARASIDASLQGGIPETLLIDSNQPAATEVLASAVERAGESVASRLEALSGPSSAADKSTSSRAVWSAAIEAQKGTEGKHDIPMPSSGDPDDRPGLVDRTSMGEQEVGGHVVEFIMHSVADVVTSMEDRAMDVVHAVEDSVASTVHKVEDTVVETLGIQYPFEE